MNVCVMNATPIPLEITVQPHPYEQHRPKSYNKNIDI